MTTPLTFSAARANIMAVVNQIVADFTTYPLAVETPNRTLIDLSKQTDPFLQVVIAAMGGDQAEIGPDPLVRVDGQLVLTAVVKSGAGVADAEDLRDFVLPYFSTQNLGGVQLQAAQMVGGRAHLGLWYEPAIIPFYYFTKLHK
jgi:hypothetical protein